MFEISKTYETMDKNSISESTQPWRNPLASHISANAAGTYKINRVQYQHVFYPDVVSGLPKINPDLSEGVASLYSEAASIANKSPRGAMALLRLALEKMLRTDFHLNFKKIYGGILQLYSDGIPEEMDIALHYLRIAGNAADHEEAGKIVIDGSEGINTVRTMMEVLNDIADDQISRKKRLKGLTRYMTDEEIKGFKDAEKHIDETK